MSFLEGGPRLPVFTLMSSVGTLPEAGTWSLWNDPQEPGASLGGSGTSRAGPARTCCAILRGSHTFPASGQLPSSAPSRFQNPTYPCAMEPFVYSLSLAVKPRLGELRVGHQIRGALQTNVPCRPGNKGISILPQPEVLSTQGQQTAVVTGDTPRSGPARARILDSPFAEPP